ncbi:tyrosine-type recombinase/integrase [Thalassolituus oleivorans]|uniref:tyrosine-type recombinase/integrase n=1 Tax=Thalassolituus oleivorans TaxID=187493 RepID=UPI0023EF64A6|nr:site-specific integrase [Thalassolituus oleivorans]
MNSEQKSYGSKQRANFRKSARRKITTEINEEMPGLIERYIPILEKRPVLVDDYERQVAALLAHLRADVSDLKRLRLMHEYLASYIAQGNSEEVWSLPVPPRMMSIKRSKSTRNAAFFQKGAAVAVVYYAWRAEFAGRAKYDDVSNDDAIADVLISAAIHGGLAHPNAVVAFANAMVFDSAPFTTFEHWLWVDLIWQSDRDPENYPIDEDGSPEWRTLHRFYPDTFTLGLVNVLRQQSNMKQDRFDAASVWSIIRRRLSALNHEGHFVRLSHLRAFCVGAQSVTEMLDGVEIPQVFLEVAGGRVASSSLCPQHHSRWLTGSLEASVSAPISFMQLQRSHSQRRGNTASETALMDTHIESVKRALRITDRGLKRTNADASADLSVILREVDNSSMRLLIGWFLQQSLEVASIRRYFSEVAYQWLYHMGDVNLEMLDEDEWEERYEFMLESKPDDGRRNYMRGRLRDLHNFVAKEINVPMLYTFFYHGNSTKKRNRVKPGMISEAVFQYMLRRLDSISDLEKTAVDGLRVLLILGYRMGLRRGELLKLRLIDVEDSDFMWLFIRNNRYGNNKTTSALRKLPPSALLLPEEFQLLKNYVDLRRVELKNQTNALLFSMPSSPMVPLDPNAVSGLVKILLHEQGLYRLSFHHLRHSAISNLALVMEGNEQLIADHTPYKIEYAQIIRRAIFSMNPRNQRDHYWSIAGVAGHLTPGTTFSNYLHVVDLLLASRLAKFDPTMIRSEARAITGLPTRVLSAVEDRYRLQSQRSEIIRRLEKSCTQLNTVTHDSTKAPSNMTPAVRKIGVNSCYYVLRDLEVGETVSVVSRRYGIDESKVDFWLASALSLQQLKTKQGNSRLFSVDRTRSYYGLPLLPSRPNDGAVAAEIDRYINGLRDVYRQSLESLCWTLDFWLNTTHTSKSGVRFTDHRDLKQFLKPLKSIIPMNRWRLELCVPESSNKGSLAPWEALGLKVLKRGTSGASIHAYLYLSHPEEQRFIDENGFTYKKYSSSVLTYVFHMLAIMVGSRCP